MRHAILIVVCLGLSYWATAQTQLSGIFQQTDAKLEYVEGVSWEKFLAKNKQLNAQGYRLLDIETSGISKDRIFWGIYTTSSEKDTVGATLGWTDFVKLKRKLDDRGYILTDLTAYALNEMDFNYIGVWRKGDTPHKVWKLDSDEALRTRTEQLAAEQYYLVGVKVVISPGGVPQYLAVYHHNPLPERNYLFIANDTKVFNTDWLQRMKSGTRLIDYDRYEVAGQMYYLGVYRPGKYEHILLSELEKFAFEDRWDRLEQQQDLQLVNLSVE